MILSHSIAKLLFLVVVLVIAAAMVVEANIASIPTLVATKALELTLVFALARTSFMKKISTFLLKCIIHKVVRDVAVKLVIWGKE